MADTRAPAFDEVYEFLVAGPSRQAIIDFRPSTESQTRISELLHRNKEESLTPDEEAELDEFLKVEQFVQMLKIKAREKPG